MKTYTPKSLTLKYITENNYWIFSCWMSLQTFERGRGGGYILVNFQLDDFYNSSFFFFKYFSLGIPCWLSMLSLLCLLFLLRLNPWPRKICMLQTWPKYFFSCLKIVFTFILLFLSYYIALALFLLNFPIFIHTTKNCLWPERTRTKKWSIPEWRWWNLSSCHLSL